MNFVLIGVRAMTQGEFIYRLKSVWKVFSVGTYDQRCDYLIRPSWVCIKNPIITGAHSRFQTHFKWLIGRKERLSDLISGATADPMIFLPVQQSIHRKIRITKSKYKVDRQKDVT